MKESAEQFNHKVTAQRYFDLYEKMLARPLVYPMLDSEVQKSLSGVRDPNKKEEDGDEDS